MYVPGAAIWTMSAPQFEKLDFSSSFYSDTASGAYGFGNGSSLATPFVSGAAALVLAQNPALTVAEVKTRLVGTYAGETPQFDASGNLVAGTGCQCGYEGGGAVDQLTSLQGRLSTGGGRLNLCKAIDGCVEPAAPQAKP